MAYDAFAESVRLIESRHVEPVVRLSRRRRSAAMAVDVDGDVAVTLFARRGVGCVLTETWLLSRRGMSWHLLGGGAGSADRDVLSPRPVRLADDVGSPAAVHAQIASSLLVVDGSGGVRDDRGRAGRWPWSGRWIRQVTLRVSADVESLSLEGRTIQVPWHGHVALVSAKRRAPEVTVHGTRGETLGVITPFDQDP